MKSKKESDAPAEMPQKTDSAFVGPCVVAALVWLALALYMQVIVPNQLDLYSQADKPEQMQAVLPAALRVAVMIHTYFGTSILSLIGLAGCGLAYTRRNVVMANVMIGLGVILLGATIWVVLVSLPKA